MLASRLADMSNAVALRKESVDRNKWRFVGQRVQLRVALRKESVDRNQATTLNRYHFTTSLSARRAWIEMKHPKQARKRAQRRSPQGERG